MTSKTAIPVAPGHEEEIGAPPWRKPSRTKKERRQRIVVMVQRIKGYVRFMRGVGRLNGTSAEAKEKAVAAFYDWMLVLEREMCRIQDELKLPPSRFTMEMGRK